MRWGSRRQFLQAITTVSGGAAIGAAVSPATATPVESRPGWRDSRGITGHHDSTGRQQDLDVQWRRTYGGDGLDAVRAMAELPGGDLVLGGFSEQAGRRGRDAWVARTSADGTLQWERRLGAALATSVTDIVLTPEDRIVVSGTTTTSTGRSDGWLAKLTAGGQTVWANRYTQGDRDVGTAVTAADGEGGVVIAGGTLSFETQRQAAWLVRVDADGTARWQRRYGDGDTGARDCLRATDGTFVIGGATFVDDSATVGWLTGVDEVGDPQWTRTYSDGASTTVESLLPLTDGGLLLTGESRDRDGDQDGWVARLDTDRDVVWQRTDGGDRSDYAWAAAERSDGFLVTGYTESVGAADKDAWLLGLDSDGNRQWATTFGGPARDFASTLLPTRDGGYLLGGDTASTDGGDQQGWLLKLTTGTPAVADRSTGTVDAAGSDSDAASGAGGESGGPSSDTATGTAADGGTAASGDGFGVASTAVAAVTAGYALARRSLREN